MRFPTFPLLILLLGACRAGGLIHDAPGPVRTPEVTRTHMWVDASWWRPGDGSRERPLRSLAEALARPGPLTVHVAAGLYPGPFTLPPGVRVEGAGPATVLHVAGAEGPALRAEQGATLADLAVQGGAWGLEVAGEGVAKLERVVFSGQRTGAVWVRAGRLEVEGSRFEASVSETTGVLVQPAAPGTAGVDRPRREPGAAPGPAATEPTWVAARGLGAAAPAGPDGTGPGGAGTPRLGPAALPGAEVPGVEARIRGSAFLGPYRRAVRVVGAGARVALEDVRFSGPVTAVGVQGGEAEVRRAEAEGGRGSAFSVVEGALVLEDVRVRGHELGVSSMEARKVEVRRFTSVRAERAGLGLAKSRAVLEDVVVQDSGSYGGVQLTSSDVEVRRLRVDGAAEYGLVAVRGTLKLRGATFTRVRSADGVTGDGLHLRQVGADVEGVVVRGAAGACVLAAQNARVALRDAELEDCRQAGLVADTLARLEATGVEVRGSGATALAAFNDGELRVDVLSASGLSEGLVWTECEGRTRVRLGRVRSEDLRGASAPCVEQAAPR